MQRKVIKQGHNTLTVTIPKKWAIDNNITPSSELNIEESGKSLNISPIGSREIKKITINTCGLPTPLIWRHLISAYRAGYDEIKIEFEPTREIKNIYTAFTYNVPRSLSDEERMSPVEAIQSLINRFVGFEIIEQRYDYCVAKDLGETPYKEFDNSLKRIFLLLTSMADETANSAKGNREGLKAFHVIDTNLDRFEDFCLRILNKRGYRDPGKTARIYNLVFLLELVGDEYRQLAVHLLKIKKLSPKMIEFVNLVHNMVKTFNEAYYGYSVEKITQLYQLDEKGFKLHEEIYPKVTDEEKELLHHLKKIGRFTISLAEIKMDLEC